MSPSKIPDLDALKAWLAVAVAHDGGYVNARSLFEDWKEHAGALGVNVGAPRRFAFYVGKLGFPSVRGVDPRRPLRRYHVGCRRAFVADPPVDHPAYSWIMAHRTERYS